MSVIFQFSLFLFLVIFKIRPGLPAHCVNDPLSHFQPIISDYSECLVFCLHYIYRLHHIISIDCIIGWKFSHSPSIVRKFSFDLLKRQRGQLGEPLDKFSWFMLHMALRRQHSPLFPKESALLRWYWSPITLQSFNHLVIKCSFCFFLKKKTVLWYFNT